MNKYKIPDRPLGRHNTIMKEGFHMIGKTVTSLHLLH